MPSFLKLMDDPWTFCSALADIYAVSEMKDPRRDAPASEALDRGGDDDEMMDLMFSDDDLVDEAE